MGNTFTSTVTFLMSVSGSAMRQTRCLVAAGR
jgi:hypothetical protein